MRVWYETLKKMYREKRASAKTLTAAVKKGWITEEERKEIMKYEKRS